MLKLQPYSRPTRPPKQHTGHTKPPKQLHHNNNTHQIQSSPQQHLHKKLHTLARPQSKPTSPTLFPTQKPVFTSQGRNITTTRSHRPSRTPSSFTTTITTTTTQSFPSSSLSPPSTTIPHPKIPLTTPTLSNPFHQQHRTFLNAMFEKQRKFSWMIHRRKKMEMSADLLSRPTYRPGRTESMDLIQKQIHDITLGNESKSMNDLVTKQGKYDTTTHTADRSEIFVTMSELTFKQRLHVYFLKYKNHSPFIFLTYAGLWVGQFLVLLHEFKNTPGSRQKYMDMMDMSAFQGLHSVIDSSPVFTDQLLAWGVTSATDTIRFPICIALTGLYYTRGDKIGIPPEYYNKIKYRYGLETPPPVEYDVSKIDPSLHMGLVNLPGTDPVPRHDFYGRDRQRDLIPKDRIDLEYVLHSWQRTNAVRRRREALMRRRKPKKKKITGPRWSKVGQGMFTRF